MRNLPQSARELNPSTRVILLTLYALEAMQEPTVTRDMIRRISLEAVGITLLFRSRSRKRRREVAPDAPPGAGSAHPAPSQE